jgi:hypothetical protein
MSDTACTHCWHDRNGMYGVTLTTWPPSPHPEVCCHCGTSRMVAPEPPPIPPGHGPHYPRPTVYPYTTY